MNTKILALAITLTACATLAASAKDALESTPASTERPIDLVICLDTSNSMDGLIGAAKQKIWDIVNELARAKPTPHLRVALYSYGTPAYGQATGYVRKEIDLTDDLDGVYAKLTALTTNGGDEYCARVIRAATREQPWSTDKDALKIIVDAGNEPATQDPQFKILDICRAAISKGIIVNTIYCGSAANSEAQGWREAAQAADGQFATIDQNKGTIVIVTPFDQKLGELSGAINKTYVAFGAQGRRGAEKQIAADAQSAQLSPSVAASRAVAKGGTAYRNATWDLVDARTQKDFDLGKIKKEDLPAEMQKMTVEEQNRYLDEMAKKRAEMQKEINELNVKRQKFIDEEMRQGGKSADKAFDAAMLRALREQAQKKGFAFEEQK